MEFDFANSESIYCRPLGATNTANGETLSIPPEALAVDIAFLPPMSGLFTNEPRFDPGAIQVRIGEGRTAEVLRNLCYLIYQKSEGDDWTALSTRIRDLFGVTLEAPEYIRERGELVMSYRDLGGFHLDLSASGRGLQQTLLLLAYVFLNPNAVLLLDEPDAHLEILRQRQMYQMLTDLLRERNSLAQAGDRELPVFPGSPRVLRRSASGREVVGPALRPPGAQGPRGAHA